MALARLYTFTAGTPIIAAQVSAEFDQHVNLWTGAKTDADLTLVYNGANTALTVRNTGAGPIARFQITGAVTKVEITNTGQISSSLATGTAPFVIVSTTMSTNLNADMVDGKHAADLLLSSPGSTITDATTPYLGWNNTTAAREFRWQVSVGGLVILRDNTAATNLLQASAAAGVTFLVAPKWASDPSANDDLVRKSYLLNRQARAQYGVLFAGVLATTDEQPVFIVPPVNAFTLTHLRATYRSGTPTGTSTLRLVHLNSAGTSVGTYDIQLTSGQTKNSIVTVDIADVNLTDGDQLRWSVAANGAHQDVSVHALMYQKVV